MLQPTSFATPDRKHRMSTLESPQVTAVTTRPATRTLLVVDDCPVIRDLLCMVFEEEGYRVLAAADVGAAQRALEGTSISAVICDIHLGSQSGLSVVQMVRKHPLHRRVPVLVMTVESSEERRHDARLAGANAFMTKPFRASQLVETIKGLVARRSASVLV